MLERFDKKKDRSLSYLHLEGASSSLENAGIAYQTPSLLSAGASAKDVALLSTITNLLLALLLVKIPSVIKLGDSLKRGTVVLGIASALGWIPLILIPIMMKGVSPVLLVILWVISLVPDLLVGPLRDKWLSDLVPASKVGRYLSLRSVISSGTYLSSFFVMGYLLDHSQMGLFSGFSWIFLIAFVGSLVSLLLYSIIKVPVPMGAMDQSGSGLLDFIHEARQNELGMFIIFSALVILSASVSGAFFSVYMLRDLHFTYLTYTLVISTEFVARIVSSHFWGKRIDGAGSIKVLRVASILIPVIPVLWLFSSHVVYLMAVQVLSGTCWAAYDLSIQSYLNRAAPLEKRLHYIVYHRSIITLAAAIGPLIGIYVLNFMFPVFGSPILGIFLLSGVLRFLVVITILHKLKDAEKSGPENVSAEAGMDYPSYKAMAGEYLSYRYTRPDRKGASINRPKTVTEIKPGLFYHPELWVRHSDIPVQNRAVRPEPSGFYKHGRQSQYPRIATSIQHHTLRRPKGIKTGPYGLIKLSSS